MLTAARFPRAKKWLAALRLPNSAERKNRLTHGLLIGVLTRLCEQRPALG